jgi:hypothetical protein
MCVVWSHTLLQRRGPRYYSSLKGRKEFIRDVHVTEREPSQRQRPKSQTKIPNGQRLSNLHTEKVQTGGRWWSPVATVSVSGPTPRSRPPSPGTPPELSLIPAARSPHPESPPSARDPTTSPPVPREGSPIPRRQWGPTPVRPSLPPRWAHLSRSGPDRTPAWLTHY